jgi:PAS domain S-box-containing protein
MCLITGYTADEMLRMRVSEITHPDDRARDWELFQAVVRGEETDYRMEKRYLRKDGSTAWVNVNMGLLRDDTGRPIRAFGFVEDVTVRKTAEAKVARLNSDLEEALAWQREIFEGSRDAIFLSDEDGRFVAVNQAAAELTGYSPSELSRMAIPDLHEGSDLGPYRTFHKRILAGERLLSAAPIRRKDGTKVAAEFNNSVVVVGGRRLVHTVARDVGERMRLEDQLRQAQKMEAVGQLAGGVAHDFNNALMVISGNAELVLSETPQDDPRRGPLVDIRKSSERAASLTQQLLAFGRKQMLAPRLVDVHEVISDVERMLQRLLGEDVTLTTELGADPSWVKIDSPQLEQAIVNLALNARDAMPRGGRISIRTRTIEPLGPATAGPDLAPGETTDGSGQRRIAISVADSGEGIPPDVRPHIFEPFFTTKEFGKGSGLGLATVYGFVKQSGGEITVESESGKGATFTVVLTAENAPPPKRVSGESRRVLPRGTETILVVEDDDAVRKIVRTTLESAGYKVVEARDGVEAIDSVRTQDARVDLVLTDIVMPGMSGREMADRLRQSSPGLPVVFMSGYTDDAVAAEGKPDTAFLQKPFTPLVLATAVRQALDAKEAA